MQNVKQARRIPVQHIPTQPPQPQWPQQHNPRQMPIPQPTGVYPYKQQSAAAVPHQSNNVVRGESPSKVNTVEIPVRHIPLVIGGREKLSPVAQQSPMEPLSPNSCVGERTVPIKIIQGSSDGHLSSPGFTKKNSPAKEVVKPALRKQTSLIVSDDHTTPIPMPYDKDECPTPLDGIAEDDENSCKPKHRHPGLRKQTSLIVHDDNLTPIPMPYDHLEKMEEELPDVASTSPIQPSSMEGVLAEIPDHSNMSHEDTVFESGEVKSRESDFIREGNKQVVVGNLQDESVMLKENTDVNAEEEPIDPALPPIEYEIGSGNVLSHSQVCYCANDKCGFEKYHSAVFASSLPHILIVGDGYTYNTK